MVAGEISGDLLGAGLIHSLKKLQHNVNVTGIGGSEMTAAGCHSLYDIERLAVMGLVEPLRRLPELFKIRQGLYAHFLHKKPDVFVGIDAPDFNLGLELKLHKAGIPTVHYVSPSVWAWRKKRIHKIAKATDLVLTLFPFELDFYLQHGVPAEFVGHPLADKIPFENDKLAARKALGLDEDATFIALLPGSRRNEIHYLAEIFVKTAKYCWEQNPTLKFITAAANDERDLEFQAHCKRIAPNLPIHFFVQRSHEVMIAADVIVVTSGTATLEAMLWKRPMIIAYRMANLTYQIAKYLVKIPFIGLPNLLANKMLVPEFIQDAVQPNKLGEAIFDFLDHPEKIAKLQNDFLTIHQQLRCDASNRAAAAILKLL